MKIFKAIKDLRNYRYIIKTVKKLETTEEWKTFKLRHDWFYRIYTVINIEPEAYEIKDERVEQTLFLDQFRKISELLMMNNLGEIMVPGYEKIPDSISYLLVYDPSFQVLSFKYIFSRFLFFLIFLFLIVNINFVPFLKMMYRLFGF